MLQRNATGIGAHQGSVACSRTVQQATYAPRNARTFSRKRDDRSHEKVECLLYSVEVLLYRERGVTKNKMAAKKKKAKLEKLFVVSSMQKEMWH